MISCHYVKPPVSHLKSNEIVFEFFKKEKAEMKINVSKMNIYRNKSEKLINLTNKFTI